MKLNEFTDANQCLGSTTFWSDFTIADRFGMNAIKDTYNRAFNEWKSSPVYLTALCICLNWKAWQWNDKNETICAQYSEFFHTVRDYALDNLKGEDLTEYLRITD